jgi:hypothetical protein
MNLLLENFKKDCLHNKYSKWYFSIIDNAFERKWSKKTAPSYVEAHHIIPKSIMKNDIVVFLTAREHFICHLLLPKMLIGKNKSKMMMALHRLIFGNKHNNVVYVKNSKQYDKIKKECSEYFSKRSFDYWNNISKEQKSLMKSGEKNSMYGKNHSDYSKKIISEKAKARLKDKTKHPLYGVGHSEETKRKMVLNAPKSSLGKKWYNNPTTKEEKYFIFGQQPENFILGRLKNG